jgi:N-acetylglutamate synthase-like GNAT family acetyltransferase
MQPEYSMQAFFVNDALMIRQATPGDLPQIKGIIDLSFPLFFRYFAAHTASDFSEPTIVSQQNGAIAGFAKLIKFQIAKDKYGCILWIAVHPNHRHKGTALALTNAGSDWLKAQGAKAVFASTQRKNKAALATLGKARFVRCGFGVLWRLFGWWVFKFYRDIWLAPGEVVLMKQLT